MGLVNPEPILSLLQAELPPIRLEDRLVPQNNMLIEKNTEEKDVISMDAGTFMQLVTGYRSVPELFDEKSGALSRLEKALPKYPCYIIDAY